MTPTQEEDNHLSSFYRYIADDVAIRTVVLTSSTNMHVRARVEHANRKVVYGHELFCGRAYMGKFEDLRAYVDITVHTTALYIRQYSIVALPGYGNWPH